MVLRFPTSFLAILSCPVCVNFMMMKYIVFGKNLVHLVNLVHFMSCMSCKFGKNILFLVFSVPFFQQGGKNLVHLVTLVNFMSGMSCKFGKKIIISTTIQQLLHFAILEYKKISTTNLFNNCFTLQFWS